MTKQLTRAEVRANREKAIAFLKNPELKKGTGRLETVDSEGNILGRCCLGHMCAAFDLKRVAFGHRIDYGAEGNTHYAPAELMELIGLKTPSGSDNTEDCDTNFLPGGSSSLANWNDSRYLDATPQKIGEYLATVIEGGKNTPFIPLSQYPETVDGN